MARKSYGELSVRRVALFVGGKRTVSCLAFLIICESLGVEFLDNLLGRAVLLDLALKVKADHVTCVYLARKLEELSETLLFCLFDVLGSHIDYEMYVDVVVVFFVVLR